MAGGAKATKKDRDRAAFLRDDKSTSWIEDDHEVEGS